MAAPLLIGSILEVGTKLIDKFFPDPAEAAKQKQILFQMQQDGELQEMESAMRVIVAEAQSEHWLVAAWRPITMLTFVVIIANNYILAPYLDAMFGSSLQLPLPPDLWDLLKIGLGGYVAGRSGEKMIKYWKGKD